MCCTCQRPFGLSLWTVPVQRQAKTSHCSVLLMLERIHLYQHRTLYIYSSLLVMSCRFTLLAQKLEEIILISRLLNGEDTKSNCTGKGIQICADPSTAFSKSSENATKKEYLYLKL